MTKATFIDASYILALVNTADNYHARAVAASKEVRPPFVTTEAVLVEIGNALSGERWRQIGHRTVQALRSDPRIQVVTVDTRLFERALELYGSRPTRNGA